MRIYSMTATFGKLNHATLELKPGLNIIEAPNEWGKSTWCAFLVAMLYGIDTRQHTTKAVLADKEKFAPWSGEPMSGRIDLNWNGRDITIERSSKGRIPFGEFRAYETATGLEVPELTAAGCGQTLLGVERSVFTRAGFIRLQDMPVTQDDSLRRRLNSLVTTGDESGAGDQLGKQLRELKNKVRYNRSGLLPQAEAEREQLRAQLQQQEDLQSQTQRLTQCQSQLEQELRQLENHRDALRYEAARQGAVKIKAAEENCAHTQNQLLAQENTCAALPQKAAAEQALQQGRTLSVRQRELLSRQQSLPQPPVCPESPACFAGMTPEQALSAAKEDFARNKALEQEKKAQAKLPLFYSILAALFLVAAGAGYFFAESTLPLIIAGTLIAISGVALLIYCAAKAKKRQQAIEELYKKYPGISPDGWISQAEQYDRAQAKYQLAAEQHRLVCGDFEKEKDRLEQEISAYTGENTLEAAIGYWQSVLQQWELLNVRRREAQNAQEHFTALQSVATTAPEPAFPDDLTLSAQETESRLTEGSFQLRQLQLQLGQCIGQADSIGQEEVLRSKLDSVSRRISRLEEYYRALELAQEALYQASSALQRRFAPRISKKAQSYFSTLTENRYRRINLSGDLSLSACAENEDTLRGAQWRSDGTVDQLYLALRLAVADELTPEAPLVLDDALIRFDDARLKAALTLLQEEAQNKQVLLFSCQGRENRLA